ncbi:malto-oligosyltrehalose trehalohydrolase [soil metagenome]
MNDLHCDLGSKLSEAGVRYRIWAPELLNVAVDILPGLDLPPRFVPMSKDSEGYHMGVDQQGRAGDAYGFRIGQGPLLPDPASRAQQDGVHGRSLVVDSTTYAWNDKNWQRPPFRDLVIYELHVGTFSAEGTFRSAAERLNYLKELGVTAVQLMPIADFPGHRNWGYDGVLIYAPAHCYGVPDDLRYFVDQAHLHGLAVILDVVYNHFGPDGNYLSAFSPHYFNKKHHTPWGDGFNFDGDQSDAVRRFFLGNPAYWMDEFHFDGFRFDATHEIQDDSPQHILADLTEVVHRRGGYAIAEDSRNERKLVTSTAQGGLGFDAVWADDFHHAVRVSHTGEKHAYYQDFRGTLEEVGSILEHGWYFRGQHSVALKSLRGTECKDLPPQAFLLCISNHDQTGNRALGERLNQLVPPAAYRAFSALLCLCPYTPMLFMGQEWAANSPFLFFTDHNRDLGRKITEGRIREFSSFPEFSTKLTGRIPDPQSADTFERSKLDWREIELPSHRAFLGLYQECLRLRKKVGAFRPLDRVEWRLGTLEDGVGSIFLQANDEEYLLLFDLLGGHSTALPSEKEWRFVLSSEEPRFGGAGLASWDAKNATISFAGPEVLVLNARKK